MLRIFRMVCDFPCKRKRKFIIDFSMGINLRGKALHLYMQSMRDMLEWIYGHLYAHVILIITILDLSCWLEKFDQFNYKIQLYHLISKLLTMVACACARLIGEKEERHSSTPRSQKKLSYSTACIPQRTHHYMTYPLINYC